MTSVDFGFLGTFDTPGFLLDPILYAFFAAAMIGAFVLLRWQRQSRDPDGRFLGEYQFAMPGEFFGGRVFEATEAERREHLDLIQGTEHGRVIAEILQKHEGKMFFYWINVRPVQNATLADGAAFMLTHHKLDDPRFAREIGNHYDWWRGRIYLKQANMAGPEGIVWRDDEGIAGDTRHTIYYPMVDYESGQRIVLENPKATIAVAAEMKVYVEAVKDAKINELRAESYRKHAEEMERIAVEKNGEVNDLTALVAQKRFDTIGEFFKRGGLSAYIGLFIGIVSAAVGYAILRQYLQMDATMLIILGGMIGLLPVAILNSRAKPGTASQVNQ